MWQDCSLTAVQRKTAFLEQSCLDQCHGVRWLTPKNCSTVYSLNLIDEFTSLFSPKVIVAGLPRESFPTEACLCGHQCFSVVAQATAKTCPGQPKKEFHRTVKGIAQMNADWKVEKAQYAEFNVPTCGKIAVWQLCRERQPFWNSHVWINAMVFVGWRQRIVLQSTV